MEWRREDTRWLMNMVVLGSGQKKEYVPVRDEGASCMLISNRFFFCTFVPFSNSRAEKIG